ncbi:MAG: Hpt domain-containing protein, partial [Burkholderiaceae bacterium]
MNMDQALQAFIDESRELLEVMENALLGIEEADEKTEMVNAIFRAAHTIKGSAGLFGLDHIVEFTHVVESVLDRVRDGKVKIEDALVALLLACRDHMGVLISALDADPSNPDPALVRQGEQYVTSLCVYLDQTSGEKILQVAVANADPENFQRIQGSDNSTDNWHISLRFSSDVLKNGMDPLSFLRYLQ